MPKKKTKIPPAGPRGRKPMYSDLEILAKVNEAGDNTLAAIDLKIHVQTVRKALARLRKAQEGGGK